MKARGGTKLKARYLPVGKISSRDIEAMHGIWTRYFDNSPFQQFQQDLRRNDGVLIVRDEDAAKIIGFTTIKNVSLTFGGKPAKGFLTSDSIIDHQYWGSNELLLGYLLFLAKAKLKSATTPLFWLLTPKSYKTYLFMAKNVETYHPRHDQPHQPEMEQLVEQFCQKLYPRFHLRGRVLDFGEQSQRYRSDIAPITAELRELFPEIEFFEQMNPDWKEGKALPCVGLIDVNSLLKYSWKILTKHLPRRSLFDRKRVLAGAGNVRPRPLRG